MSQYWGQRTCCIKVVGFHFESRAKSLGVCLERYVVSTECGECLSTGGGGGGGQAQC